MKMQSLSLISLILCAQAIAFVACDSDKKDMGLKPSVRHDQQQTNTRGAEAIIHERRGAYGGSDLDRKPGKYKNGVDDLAVKVIGGIVSMLVNCVFLLV